MKRIILSILFLSFFTFFYNSASSAIEVAPRISDREIGERLTRLEEGQKNLDKRLDDLRSEMNSRLDDLRSDMNNRFDDLRSEMNNRFGAVDKRIDGMRSEMNSRFEGMDKRFDILTWMFGLFITIALVILGAVVRIQWQIQKKQTKTEAFIETQKDELTFLKGLIEKLLPPKGVV